LFCRQAPENVMRPRYSLVANITCYLLVAFFYQNSLANPLSTRVAALYTLQPLAEPSGSGILHGTAGYGSRYFWSTENYVAMVRGFFFYRVKISFTPAAGTETTRRRCLIPGHLHSSQTSPTTNVSSAQIILTSASRVRFSKVRLAPTLGYGTNVLVLFGGSLRWKHSNTYGKSNR
jgi:hypothetical protein